MGIRRDVQSALDWLTENSTPHDYGNRARFGITAGKAYGVSMANIQKLAKSIGRDRELASALWKTAWYEARLLTSFVDEPALVTAAQYWTPECDVECGGRGGPAAGGFEGSGAAVGG